MNAILTPPNTPDLRRFPRLAAYLRDLPNGIASYPTVQTKASIYREALEDKPLVAASPFLPPELADLALRPRLVSTWVPTVHVQGLYLAVADFYSMSFRDFARWSFDCNRRLLNGPLYRMLASVASPTVLLQGATMKWSAIHRGTGLEVLRKPSGAEVRMTYPENLYVALNIAGFSGSFEAILELSRAKFPRVDVLETTPTLARFTATWK